MKKKEMAAWLIDVASIAIATTATAMALDEDGSKASAPSDDMMEGVICGIVVGLAYSATLAKQDGNLKAGDLKEDVDFLVVQAVRVSENRRKLDEGGIR